MKKTLFTLLLLLTAMVQTARAEGDETVEYTITFHLDGGFFPDEEVYTYDGTERIVFSDPYKPGYDFTGWTGTGINGTATQLEIPEGSTGNREYTAHYTSRSATGYWTDEGNRDTSWGTDYESATLFTISTPQQLAQLAYMVNTPASRDASKYSFYGKTIQLNADINLSGHEWLPMGYNKVYDANTYLSIKFDGTFDGQGHTISGMTINQPGVNTQAFFGYLNNATVQNVVFSNSTVKGGNTVGIIGGDYSGGVMRNCHVLSDCSVNAGSFLGGLIGYSMNVTITGCSSAATINGDNCAGLVGDCTSTMTNCFYYGPQLGYGIGKNGSTITASHCFYTNADYGLSKGDDSKATTARVYSITAGEGVSISRGSVTATGSYYGGQLVFYGDDGCTLNGTHYATEGATLQLAYSGTLADGYHLTYTATGEGATVSGSTLTVGTGNVSVEVLPNDPITYTITYNLEGGRTVPADANPTAYNVESSAITLVNPTRAGYTFTGWTGTDLGNELAMSVTIPAGSTGNRTYTANWQSVYSGLTDTWSSHAATEFSSAATNTINITSEAELALLANRVNDGTSYSGYTITLSKSLDLSSHEWVAIGTATNDFEGIFDGQGHTIKGVNVNKSTVNYQGLFGYCNSTGSTIKNLTLANSHIAGYDYTGAIVGSSAGTIENCHVLATVTVSAADVAENTNVLCHGGVAGYSFTIRDCTSAALLEGTRGAATYRESGGITGFGTNVEGCLFYGTETGSLTGTVVGDLNTGATTYTNYRTVPLTTDNDDDKNSTQRIIAYDANPGTDMMGSVKRNYTGSTGYTVYEKGVSYGGKYYNTSLILQDAADNSALLSRYDGEKLNVIIKGRTLYKKDGSWNTICLPFGIDRFLDTPLYLADIRSFVSSTYNESKGTLTLNFSSSNVTFTKAGVPYICRWNPESDVADETDLTFKDVTISNVAANVTTDAISFVGNYSPVTLAANDRSVLYLGGSNTLYWPTSDVTIGSFRAYFQLADGITAATNSAEGRETGVRELILNLGDGEATGIKSLAVFPEGEDTKDYRQERQQKGMGVDGVWYTLSGQRLNSRPTKNGIYLHNGKTVVVK